MIVCLQSDNSSLFEEMQFFKLKNENKCDICGYYGTSSTSLKSHINKTHKQELLRHSVESENLLILSPPSTQRDKELSILTVSPTIQF